MFFSYFLFYFFLYKSNTSYYSDVHPEPFPNDSSTASSHFEDLLVSWLFLQHAPSVQMKHIPPDAYLKEYDDDMFPDLRNTQQELDKRVEHPAEFY